MREVKKDAFENNLRDCSRRFVVQFSPETHVLRYFFRTLYACSASSVPLPFRVALLFSHLYLRISVATANSPLFCCSISCVQSIMSSTIDAFERLVEARTDYGHRSATSKHMKRVVDCASTGRSPLDHSLAIVCANSAAYGTRVATLLNL